MLILKERCVWPPDTTRTTQGNGTRILQPCGSNMPFQMADANEGKPECVRQALGVIDPNDHAPASQVPG